MLLTSLKGIQMMKKFPIYLFISQSLPILHWNMIPKNILELLRPFKLKTIGRWSSNSLEINILVLNYREFMMLAMMDGQQRIFIVNAITKDGR